MRTSVFALLVLAACQSTPERAPLSVEALISDAPAYVASRYRPDELREALIADLTGADFACGRRAMVDECVRADPIHEACFNLVTVRIDPAAPVRAERITRCLGARPGSGR